MPSSKAPINPIIRLILAVVYVGLALLLSMWGTKLWGTYCEGFGCTGLGLAWLMWCAIYAFALAIGGINYIIQTGVIIKIILCALLLQFIAGIALFGYWAINVAP